jgi:hypothetical protein
LITGERCRYPRSGNGQSPFQLTARFIYIGYSSRMVDLIKTALLLEEKAADLPHGSTRRAHLLGIAETARQLGLAKTAERPRQEEDPDGETAEDRAGVKVS